MKPEVAVKLERRWGWLVFPVHKWLFKTTRGVVGGKFEGRPMVLLHHVGRKTGAQRETLIQYYPHSSGDLVIVGSNGGRDNHPAWVHNLKANPVVEVDIRGKHVRAHARVLDGEERELMWKELAEFYPGYPHYQTLTDRKIEVVALTPEP